MTTLTVFARRPNLITETTLQRAWRPDCLVPPQPEDRPTPTKLLGPHTSTTDAAFETMSLAASGLPCNTPLGIIRRLQGRTFSPWIRISQVTAPRKTRATTTLTHLAFPLLFQRIGYSHVIYKLDNNMLSNSSQRVLKPFRRPKFLRR